LWTHLERQKGGIGMRGPGETEIETDRRIVRDRISLLKCDIEGGEYDLIPSLTDKQMSMIDKFMIEIHSNDNNQIRPILDKLESCGFKYKIYCPTLNSMELGDKTTLYGMLVTY
jgi:hypothetical protein